MIMLGLMSGTGNCEGALYCILSQTMTTGESEPITYVDTPGK